MYPAVLTNSDQGSTEVRLAQPPVGAPSRPVPVSRQEAEMMVRIAKGIVKFAGDFPLEFHSYCPLERWKPILEKVFADVQSIERQLQQDVEPVMVDADTIFAMTDVEECVSGSRDKRLLTAKWALGISAFGAVVDFFLGLKYVATAAYVTSLALVLGTPLSEYAKEVPSEPFRPDVGLSGCGAPPSPQLGDHTDKTKVLERVLVATTPAIQQHHWGSVMPGRRMTEGAVCLKKGKFRVRCEGWSDDVVMPAEGWEVCSDEECSTARHPIAVWEPGTRPPRVTHFGAVPKDSGFENTFWVEYVGPLTDGVMRRAGPFG